MEKYSVRRRNLFASVVIFITLILWVLMSSSLFYAFIHNIDDMREMERTLGLDVHSSRELHRKFFEEIGISLLALAIETAVMVICLISTLRWSKTGYIAMAILAAVLLIELPSYDSNFLLYFIYFIAGTVLVSLLLLLKGKGCKYSALKMLWHPEFYSTDSEQPSPAEKKVEQPEKTAEMLRQEVVEEAPQNVEIKNEPYEETPKQEIQDSPSKGNKKMWGVLAAVLAVLGIVFVVNQLLSGPKHIEQDLKMFGLKGDVCKISDFRVETNKEWLSLGNEMSIYEMTFDQNGRLTQDEFGNIYVYDSKGEFISGNHYYTTMSRNAEGYIEIYSDWESGTDDADGFTVSYEYDENGHIRNLVWDSWYGAQNCKYEWDADGNMTYYFCENGFEGGDSENKTESYEYTAFDDKGNWTQRRITRVVQKEIEKPVGRGDYKTVKVSEKSFLEETRTITYYDK